jgi:hypothetical protein
MKVKSKNARAPASNPTAAVRRFRRLAPLAFALPV